MSTAEFGSSGVPRWLRLLVGTHFVTTGLLLYWGGTALHLWTGYLFYKNWGSFWAGIIALGLPVFSELIGLVGCLHSELWYYSLAVGAWCAALGSLCILVNKEQEDPLDFRDWTATRRLLFAAAAAAMYAFLGSFCFFAARDAFGQKSLSEDQRQEAEDAATSFYLVTLSAVSFEPDATARASKAKAELRSTLAEFNAAQLAEIDRHVRAIFRSEAILSRDFGLFLLDGEPLRHHFSESSELREAISTLPPKARTVMNMQLSNMDDDFRKAVEKAGDSGATIRIFGKARDYVWSVYKREYEDVFKRTMPSREELLKP